MTTKSIERTRNLRDRIRENLKIIRASDFVGQKFGEEHEFCIKGLIAGTHALLTDVSALTRAPARFIQISTASERQQLVTALERIYETSSNQDIEKLASAIDVLKPILRGWGVRHTFERFEEFDKYLSELQRKSASIEERIIELEELESACRQIESRMLEDQAALENGFEELTGKQKELDERISDADDKRSELDDWLSQTDDAASQIQNTLAQAKANYEIISDFNKKIAEREQQLERQEARSDHYSEQLAQFEKEHENHLQEAKHLLESARLALEYKTAEGLSAAFTEQYQKSSSMKAVLGWLFGSGLFICSAIGVGLWTLLESDLTFVDLLARLSLLPLLVGCAWFCATQYVKQKNISEDYAFKSVLAKSIVGFADQLSSENARGDDYSAFIRSVMKEIHNDPLRNRSLAKENPLPPPIVEILKAYGSSRKTEKTDNLSS